MLSRCMESARSVNIPVGWGLLQKMRRVPYIRRRMTNSMIDPFVQVLFKSYRRHSNQEVSSTSRSCKSVEDVVGLERWRYIGRLVRRGRRCDKRLKCDSRGFNADGVDQVDGVTQFMQLQSGRIHAHAFSIHLGAVLCEDTEVEKRLGDELDAERASFLHVINRASTGRGGFNVGDLVGGGGGGGHRIFHSGDVVIVEVP